MSGAMGPEVSGDAGAGRGLSPARLRARILAAFRGRLPAGLPARLPAGLPVRLSAGLSSVRLRATAAATLVVALALGAAAAVLVVTLRGSLEASTDAEAARRAVAAAPMLIQSVEGTQAAPTTGTAPDGATGTSRTTPDGMTGTSRTAPDPTGTGPEGTAHTVVVPPAATVVVPSGDTAVVPRAGQVALVGRIQGTPAAPADTSALTLTSSHKAAPANASAVPGTEVKPVGDPDVVLVDAAGKAAVDQGWAQPDLYAVAALKVDTKQGTSTVWARASRAGADEALQTLDSALLPGVPALLAVVAAMTWFSVSRALKPVAAIRAKMADITARDLHQRVPVPRSRDEIAALATTVNGTLDRLETAVGTHQRFVADAAHELRSPIATLRARLELAPPSELTREALADVERLQALAGDLLMLARLDAGEPVRTTSLDLGQVAFEESVRYGPGAEPKVVVDIEPDVVVRGSRGHLARLVTNLLDNARRHAGTTVTVRVRPGDGVAVLEVLDDGPGIPPEHREAVFDRFTRLDEARARDDGGAGLGLPIARDIAGLHGGTLVAIDGGFRATLPVPR
ncbi:sensor histidine kinase [Nonomuraea roseoviolacea]|uniref:histidine kinase n=1 Tax=Nonomuraea roseoviolacea subsp. carminata TaxID=160689 RepID=A0ABT1JZQ9_9ACTN|nr:HAMP domain-containing sensor histidine kinase [Nonomuraea roseoviolacea]MCP2347237.1 signal transduction histidine kinase/type II secretory pathway pseudopilin PulG [Nonomuraea roseoviolacea subsp. carminata]